MSQKIVKVLGYADEGNQFVVNARNLKIRISKNNQFPELEGASPLEYILAGYAGCISAVGQLVANELGIVLKSLQVELTSSLNLGKYQGKKTSSRAGFENIKVVVKPISDATFDELRKWLLIVENRCPVQDNLLNPTPISIELYKEYSATA